jgi:hypothetical protein
MLMAIGIPLGILSLVVAWRLSPDDFYGLVRGILGRRPSPQEGLKPASTTADHSA